MSDNQKILVTGGTGFIGSHTVVELINSGYEPVIIDNFSNSERRILKGLKEITGKEISFYEGDCRDKEKLNSIFKTEKNIRGVIHFAAYKAVGESVQEPLKYYTNNIESLAALLETMKQNGVDQLVFSSSCTVYGQPEKLPVTEESPMMMPFSPYGKTKLFCENIISDMIYVNPQMKAISLRYFNPIGAHPSGKIGELPLGRPNNLLPYITQSAAGLQEPVTIYGNDYPTPDGTCVRDYIHVVDLAKAHARSISYIFSCKAPHCEAINAGMGKGISVLELVQTFERVNNLKLNYKFGPRRRGDVPEIYAEVKKAKEVLGWQYELTLEDAVRDAWKWEKGLRG